MGRLWRPSQLRKCRTGSSHLALSQWACPLRLLARTVGRLALRLLARMVGRLALRLLAARTVARTVGRLALRLLARTVEALLARTVEASPPRLLARTVEELWAAAMAMSGQLSEQAQALLRDWSFFHNHSLSLFYVPLCLARLEFFALGARVRMLFLELSMLPSYCGRVLIALRAFSSANISCLTRASPLQEQKNKYLCRCPSDIFLSRPKRSVFILFFDVPLLE